MGGCVRSSEDYALAFVLAGLKDVDLSSRQAVCAAVGGGRGSKPARNLARSRRAEQSSCGGICGTDRSRQPALCRDRRRQGGQNHSEPADDTRSDRDRGTAAVRPRHRESGRRKRCGGGDHHHRRPRARSRFACGWLREGGARDRPQAGRPQLPRRVVVARQAQCQFCGADAAHRRSCSGVAVRRHHRGPDRMVGGARYRVLGGGLAWRHDRRRSRRPARLLRARWSDTCDSPVRGVDQQCAQIHVGRARGRPDQAGRRGQVGAPCARREGGADAYRRARRLGRGLRSGVSARRPIAGARPRRVVRCGRDARAGAAIPRQAAGDLDQRRGHRGSGRRPSRRSRRHPRRHFAGNHAEARIRRCRRSGREPTPSTSPATPIPPAMSPRSRVSSRIPRTMPSWS